MSDMNELVLAKLVELALRPTAAQLSTAQANASHLQAMTMRQGEQIAKLRDDARKADTALTELWKAAKDVAAPRVSKSDNSPPMLALRRAIKNAEPLVDQIPF